MTPKEIQALIRDIGPEQAQEKIREQIKELIVNGRQIQADLLEMKLTICLQMINPMPDNRKRPAINRDRKNNRSLSGFGEYMISQFPLSTQEDMAEYIGISRGHLVPQLIKEWSKIHNKIKPKILIALYKKLDKPVKEIDLMLQQLPTKSTINRKSY